MTELFLIYKDDDGETYRVHVDRDGFTIGRHSENDLCIVNTKLSRNHVEIHRSAGDFIVSDVGSSNGTKLNGLDLIQSEPLSNGDILDLGGGVEISVEFDSADHFSSETDQANSFAEENVLIADHEEPIYSDAPGVAVSTNNATESDFSFGKLMIIAPLLVIFVLAVVGIGLLVLNGKSQQEITSTDDDENLITSRNRDDDEDDEVDPQESKTPVETQKPVITPQSPVNTDPVGTEPSNTDIKDDSPATDNRSANAQSERAAISFMRRIARNDPSPVLTTRQLEVVEAKIKQFKGSTALASNINNARANISGITALARSKNLKPQFLANAGLTKLGNRRGDVLAAAQSMLEVLDNLNIQIGDEVADESLVAIAAYQQGVSGKFLQMRNTMERLTSKNPSVSSRQVRTIWFLRDKGKLSNAEFEFALRYLAIGTITQDPKHFGVNSEALTL